MIFCAFFKTDLLPVKALQPKGPTVDCGLVANGLFDKILSEASQGIPDPSDLPDGDLTISKFPKVTGRLRNGKLEGQSTLARSGDSCMSRNGLKISWLKGTIRLTQVKAKYRASVGKIGVASDVFVSVNDVTVALRADIVNPDTCEVILTQFDGYVGNIQVSVGKGVTGKALEKVTGFATSMVTSQIFKFFRDILRQSVQDAMNNSADLKQYCA